MVQDIAEKNNPSEVRRRRFIRIVERRVDRILDDVDTLGKCSNRRNYEYSDQDVKKIFSVIDKKIKETKLLFQNTSGNKKGFKLEV